MSWTKLLATTTLALGMTGASFAAGEADPLRAILEDSKAQQKGLTFFVSGHPVPGIVVNITDKYVIARSQAQGTIVLRLDRIDGVAGFVSDKK